MVTRRYVERARSAAAASVHAARPDYDAAPREVRGARNGSDRTQTAACGDGERHRAPVSARVLGATRDAGTAVDPRVLRRRVLRDHRDRDEHAPVVAADGHPRMEPAV